MAKRNIRMKDDEILRKICKPVKAITPSVITLLDDMVETMNEANGVGLAAPQVGILKRIAVVNVGEQLFELINPVVLETKGEQIEEEGCLSLPGAWARVARPTYVKVSAQNRNGEYYTVEGTELLAIALCHEIDHLDGILYIDKALPEEDE